MDNKSGDQLLIMQATIETSSQDSDEKMKILIEDLTAIIASMMGHIKFSKYSTDKKESPKVHDHTTVVPTSKKDPPLEGGNSTQIVAFGISNTGLSH